MARGEIRVHWPLLLSCGLCLLGLNVDDAAGVATGPGSTPVHFQQLNLRKDDANQSKVSSDICLHFGICTLYYFSLPTFATKVFHHVLH